MDTDKHLKFLERFFPAIKGVETHIYNGQGLPLWINKSVQIVVFAIHSNQKVALVFLEHELEFDQIVNIQRQVQKRMNAIVVIVADNQTSKYRPLFVREGVAFIFKNETIFAPELGVRFFNSTIVKKVGSEYEIREELVPFEVKLLSGYLTNFLTHKMYNLDDILKILINNNYRCSKGKISNTVRSLLKKRIVMSEGCGPNRTMSFKGKAETWQLLEESQIAKSHRLVESNYDLGENKILSGETALACYSDLSAPIVKTAALTNKEFQDLKSAEPANIDRNSPKTYIQIRKESPALFSINGCLNPVELFLDLRKNQDERIQISLDHMINKLKSEVA